MLIFFAVDDKKANCYRDLCLDQFMIFDSLLPEERELLNNMDLNFEEVKNEDPTEYINNYINKYFKLIVFK